MHKKYLLFAIPLILSALLSRSYNMINSFMIGKFIGSAAFAATAVTEQLIEFLNSIFFGYLIGVGIYVSVLFGRNENEKMVNVIKINLLLSTSVAIVISVLCNLFCGQIFEVLNVSEEIYKNAEAYFRAYMVGLPIFQFSWCFVFISNGMGITKMPLFGSVVTGVFNVTLNYLFLGVMHKGIGYSAVASIIATVAVLAYYLTAYTKIFRNMGVAVFGKRLDPKDLKASFEYGTPTMLQQMTMYCCMAVVSPLINTCSTAALSGYSVANKALTIIQSVYQNSSKANTNLIAQAMGAKRIDKIKEGIKIGITQGLLLFGATLSLFMLFAQQFTALFLDPVADAESFAVCVATIRYLFPLLLFNVFNNLFHGVFRAVGSGKLMFVSTLIYAVSFVVYAYILFGALPTELKIYGAHMSHGAAYLTELVFAAWIFIKGKWKTEEYKALEAQSD